MRFSRNLLSLFNLAYEVADRLPRQGDPLLTWGIKMLAIANCAHQAYYGSISAVEEMIQRYNLQEKSSASLIAFLSEGKVLDGYPTRRLAVTAEEEWIEILDPQGERLFLREWRNHRKARMASEFFHTPAFDFTTLLAKVWTRFDNSVYVSYGEYDEEPVPLFAPLPASATALSPAGERRIQDLSSRAPNRTYLVLGLPGVGKSSLVRRFAEVTGGKLLKIDAGSLESMQIQELNFLLEALQPEIVVVDDFDQTPFERIKAKLLFLLEALHGKRTLFLTANSVEGINRALLRAGRLSEIVDVGMPDEEERRWMLSSMLKKSYDEAALLADTDGFSHADIVDLCECANASLTMEEALKIIARIQDVADNETSMASPSPQRRRRAPYRGPLGGMIVHGE
jgi:hypothetical protein